MPKIDVTQDLYDGSPDYPIGLTFRDACLPALGAAPDPRTTAAEKDNLAKMRRLIRDNDRVNLSEERWRTVAAHVGQLSPSTSVSLAVGEVITRACDILAQPADEDDEVPLVEPAAADDLG